MLKSFALFCSTLGRSLILSAAFTGLAVTAWAADPGMLWDAENEVYCHEDFARVMKLTVAYEPTVPLTNFPVLVRLSEGAEGFRYADVHSATGADILFVDDAGRILPHEVDTWNASGESLVWVKVPELTNGTSFAMCYRSAKDGSTLTKDSVWANYTGVWHMGEPGDGVQTVRDSSANALDMTTHANSLAESGGWLGGARRVSTKTGASDSNGRILLDLSQDEAKKAAVDALGTSFVASLCLKIDNSNPDWAYLIGRKETDQYNAWAIQFNSQSDATKIRVHYDKTNAMTPTVTALNQVKKAWVKLDFVYNGKDYVIYANGKQAAAGTGKVLPVYNNGNFAVGGCTESGYGSLNGWVDEVRLRAGVPSAAWVAADYATATVDGFLTKGTVVERAEKPVPIAALSLFDVGPRYAQFSVMLDNFGGAATKGQFLAKVWKTGAAEPTEWTTLEGALALRETYRPVWNNLEPETAYAYRLKVINELENGETDVLEGTFTTGGTGGPGSGGDRYRLMNDYVHRYIVGTEDLTFTAPDHAQQVQVLLVGGGGAGGYCQGGGGGAGGFLYRTLDVTPGTAYSIAVGRGGIASNLASERSADGTASTISAGDDIVLSAAGGGAGGNFVIDSQTDWTLTIGANGGSGGGNGYFNYDKELGTTYVTGYNKHVSEGISGQGFAGGAANIGDKSITQGNYSKKCSSGGGGGGAFRAGGNATEDDPPAAGCGGDGRACDISGVNLTYAGGGGGGSKKIKNSNQGNENARAGGGAGGGGAGGWSDLMAESGVNGLGGGGGGGSGDNAGSYTGGNGGSGCVYIRYPAKGAGAGSAAPVVSLLSLEMTGALTAAVDYRVAWAGAEDKTCAVSLVYGTSPNALTSTVPLASDVIGTRSATVSFAAPDTTYYVRVRATNAQGEASDSDDLLVVQTQSLTETVSSSLQLVEHAVQNGALRASLSSSVAGTLWRLSGGVYGGDDIGAWVVTNSLGALEAGGMSTDVFHPGEGDLFVRYALEKPDGSFELTGTIALSTLDSPVFGETIGIVSAGGKLVVSGTVESLGFSEGKGNLIGYLGVQEDITKMKKTLEQEVGAGSFKMTFESYNGASLVDGQTYYLYFELINVSGRAVVSAVVSATMRASAVLTVDDQSFSNLEEAFAQMTIGSVVVLGEGVSFDSANGSFRRDGEVIGVLPAGMILQSEENDSFTVKPRLALAAALRISEIMPKPVDKPVSTYYPETLERMDPNGLESGWVELENTSESDYADLADYKFLRVNRGKATSKGDYGNFPSVLIAPKAKYVFWTSERYSNSADMTVSAWATADADGARPKLYGSDLGGMLVWPDKVNPKKSPFVRLVYTGGETEEIVDTVVIPSDVPEGHSVIVNPVAEGEATVRYLTDRPTRGTANTTEGLVALGPNAGPLYELSSQKKHDSASEFARNAAPAKQGVAYPITFSLNPTMSPTDIATNRAEDAITAITLVYRAFGGEEKTVQVDLATDAFDAADWGHTYQTAIPAADLPAAGRLVQWKFRARDAAGNVWTTPSFHNKDDGYEWYGTIVEPTADQVSASLPTWHMFAAGDHLTQMDRDKEKQDLAKVPNYARVAIYDQSTSNYYDYVRIDLRGNTSAYFQKKSHGLRFAKAHPLTMTDGVRGGEVEEVRKSSLIGEPADPSYMRQMVAFWLWNRMGNKVPFDFPVRCNMNGAFYQLAFHSERFTDELIEDFYGLDKFGYGYKNVGTFKSGSSTTSGGIEKKTPDDGKESDITVLERELRAKIKGAQNVSSDVTGENTQGLDNAALTKFVVQKFNLPAWLNYLASARITHETDDVWGNISAYYDNAEMKEGTRGTDTWMPLGYDFNLTFGQHYKDYDPNQFMGIFVDQDWYKSHPFYGGNRVRSYKTAEKAVLVGNGNDAIESVWQSAKFRRLYLRRLRTLMDQELKAPGTAEADVPFMAEMRRLATLMQADVALDKEKWPHAKETSSQFKAINNWTTEAWPATMDAGIDEIWRSYVVPRQTHLYVTHAATNTAKAVGYASNLNAGIPAAQSALDDLKAGLSAEAVEGGVVIRNTNAETIDLSGWKVSGPVAMTLPAGTVLDQGTAEAPGEVFVVTDRRAYVTANASVLTNQVIVGNATAGSADSQVGLDAADGTIVISADEIFLPDSVISGAFDVPVRLASAGKYTLQGASFNAGLTLSEGGLYTIKNDGAAVTNSASSVSAAAASIAFTGKGAFRLAGAKTSGTLMEVYDLFVSNGVFLVESKATTPETSAVVVNGNFAVEDKGTVSLKLTKNANTGRGLFMASKNKFCRIGNGGTFMAEVNGPAAQAIHGEKGSVDLAIEPGATVTGTSSGKNVRFFKMAGNIVIAGGTVDLTATDEGAELLSAEKSVKISGGTLTLATTDDCVSAQKSIEVSGGTLVGQSSANDVLDSNGTITISGGTLVLLATADGHEGLDYQPAEEEATPVEHWLKITGGIVYATGGANAEAFTPEADGQPYAKLETAEAAGIVTVTADGTIHGFVKPAGACTVLVSVPALAGEAAEAAAFPDGATMVLDPYYATWLARAPKVAPGTTLNLAATDAAGAVEEIKKIDLVLSEEDEAAGLELESLVVVAEPVTDAAGKVTGYRAVVAVNPETVSAPVIGGTDDGSVKPIELQPASDGSGSTVSLGISNAVKGLWYGYEVSDAPNGKFTVDVPSFARATKAVLTITGSKRTAQSGFFRVLVLPARPQR